MPLSTSRYSILCTRGTAFSLSTQEIESVLGSQLSQEDEEDIERQLDELTAEMVGGTLPELPAEPVPRPIPETAAETAAETPATDMSRESKARARQSGSRQAQAALG